MTSKAASFMLNKTLELRYSLELEAILARIVSFCSLRSLKEGICVHAPLIKLCLHDHLYLNNNLLLFYGKCFGLKYARQLFDEMPHRDVVSWSGILSTNSRNGHHQNTIDAYREMEASGTCQNAFTFSSVLQSCSALSDLEFGKRVHGCLVKHGLQSNPVLGSSLIELYSQFDNDDDTDKVFRLIDEGGDVVSWTAMISSSVCAGKWGRALKHYANMINAGISPNGFTFSKILSASGALGLKFGKLVHAHVVVYGVEMNLVLKTSLVEMYSKSKAMKDAVKVAKLTSESDEFLWTRIVSGFAHNSKLEEPFAAFRDMRIAGVSPNEVTYLVLLGTCSSLKSLELGRQIHSRVIAAGFDENVKNSLLDMYLKCSNMVEDGLRVFREMKSPNVVSWTSVIAGFSDSRDSFGLYMEMKAAGLQPATYTLSILLEVCRVMKSLSQTLQLHTHVIKANACQDIFVGNCLVDAYAGSGRFEDAWQVVRTMNRRDGITYTSLATRLNQSGHHEKALEIVKSHGQ